MNFRDTLAKHLHAIQRRNGKWLMVQDQNTSIQ
jgi:hypothetical protein